MCPKAPRFTVKLFSPWHTSDLVRGDVCFSPGVALQDADGALWEYSPDATLLGYRGPKAWYSWEPRWHSQYRTRLVRSIKTALEEGEWLHYAHALPEYRVPHITNCGARSFLDTTDREDEATAI